MDANVRAARDADAPAVLELLRGEGLEASFLPAHFTVLEHDGRVVACARLKPLPDGSHELANVAVRRDLRGRGLGARVVAAALAEATGPIHALALAPDFFARLGFKRAERAPEVLRAKAEGLCAASAFVPMVCPDNARS